MRQRITFLQQPQDAVDPKSVEVLKSSVSAKKIRAAREDRITFGFSELPQELYRVLKASHELHIRWISPDNFDTSLPLLSRLPPGLHTFYSPQRNSKAPDLLCPALKKVFGDIDCVSPEESFTKLSVERFASNAATQYYQPLEDLTDLVEYVKHKLCKLTEQECLSRVALLQEASSVDIDFDTISHALNIAAYWTPRTWNLDVANKGGKDRVEVGFLSPEEPLQPEELSLGGFLTVVGEDSKLSPTLFSFPARHHPSTTKYSSSFLSPTGLHPTLQLSINSVSPPVSDRSCSLHTYLTLPRTIFPDNYQLADPLFLASKNLSSIHHVSSPVDLEAPDYAMKIWGSSLLVELAPPRSSKSFTSEIPLHLRYLAPTYNTSGLTSIEIPYPVLFWACTADEGSKFTVNPFDRVNIGYDGLFGPKTMFYHATPQAGATGRLMNEVTVPVLDLEKSRWVERGTAGVVLLGFLWIIWCLFGVWRKAGYGSGAKAPAAVMKKKQ
ncbi:protease B nonderepressible form [Clarireedia jacksonii]